MIQRLICLITRRHRWSRVECFERLASLTVRRTCVCGAVREVSSR